MKSQKQKKPEKWLDGYRKKFAFENMQAKTTQQARIVKAFQQQIALKKRSPVRLFAAALDVPANYIWNNAKIYWGALVEKWEALEVDDSFELVKALN